MCEHCGRRSVGRLCKSCELVERHDEEANRPCNQGDLEDAPECFECDGDATGGAYCPDRIGVLLCRDCHPDPDNGRKPAGDSGTAVATDGGVDIEDQDDEETETHVPDEDCVVMSDGGRITLRTLADLDAVTDDGDVLATVVQEKAPVVLEADDSRLFELPEPNREWSLGQRAHLGGGIRPVEFDECPRCEDRIPKLDLVSDQRWGETCPSCHDELTDNHANDVVMTDGGVDKDELPNLHVGDHVVDRDADDDDAATMLVVNLDTLRADAYELEDGRPTVADVNPDYSETGDVVEVTFPQRSDLDVDKKRYAYPRGRLLLKQPIHDRDEEVGDDALATAGEVQTLAEHIVESHTNIDDRLTEIEDRLDRAERDIDIIDGGL